MLTGFHPAQAEVEHQRGLQFFQQGQVDAAIRALGLALQIRPEFTLAQQNLKLALSRKIHDCGLPAPIKGQDERLDALAGGVCAAQRDPNAWEALSHWFYHDKNFAAAEICLQNAALQSEALSSGDRGRIFLNLAIIALDLRKPIAAHGYASEAMRIDPANPEIGRTFSKAHGNYLADLTYDPYTSRQDIFEHHRAWGEWHRLPGRSYSHKKVRKPRGKLRLGLVSADFYSHPVGIFLYSIMELIDYSRFEVVCYAEIRVEDSLTKAFRSRAVLWRSISALNDMELAQRIHEDKLDILIDLSGHTGGNRLRAFTLKPAPVQLSFIGYWDTTGVAEMDYLITDGDTVPSGDEQYFTEKILRMPVSRFCYRPPAFAPDIIVKPTHEPILFGCFNNDKKINDEVISCWAAILKSVPDSRLLLKWRTFGNPARAAGLVEQFKRFDIGADRLIIEGESTYDVVLGLYNKVDIALDPFPFTGGLTTCDALWMGVPVVTLYGDRPVGRQSASFLRAIGASELIAEGKDDYVGKCIALAKDKPRLQAYKGRLRQRMLQSPLLNPEVYTREFEKLLLSCVETRDGPRESVCKESIYIVSASRLSKSTFNRDSLLGRTLKKYPRASELKPLIAYSNKRGLPDIYNKVIEEADETDILVFMHDDVAFEDINFQEQIVKGLEMFDVIGVAGNTRRIPNQPAWIFSHIENGRLIWDKEYLSGEIYHRAPATGELKKNYYGIAPRPVKLLDGVMLAVRAGTLKKTGVRFDPRFDFHFYDVDFCRSCEMAGLSMGTWPISLQHDSEGNYGGSWLSHYNAYLAKWGS